uniref:Uncharacterized protein n=1 Tax=viral metagenome TaxID=1070528 RepID=A0A6C0FDK7_9ZZZZ|tara:strand:- start:6904 stop:7179 length:276 start_codon:yes stop_codon:yes gene_type:complete
MSKSKPQLYDFLYLIIIIVITIILGVSFGNKLVVHENFMNISKVKEGLKKAKTVRDVKREGMKVVNRAIRANERFVGGVRDNMLEKFGLAL